MTTSFPTALDALTNPAATDPMNSVTVPHAEQHANANDAIEALQAKVGIEGSSDQASLDYRVAAVETGKETAGSATAAVSAHTAASDPHPQYTTTAEASAAAPVQSVAGKTGTVALAKGDVGLGSVDNTSDADKPISSAVSTALSGKASNSHNHDASYVKVGVGVTYVTGLTADGITDNLTPIQAALDAAGAAGGGVVYLPAGVFLCSNVLAIPSNTVLMGCGKESSVVRNPSGSLPGKVLDGFWTYATIAMVGVNFSGVVNVGVDHSTHSSAANGIQIGAVAGHTKNCFVKDCKVSGFDSHQYLIWNLRADNTVISGNTLVGNMAPASANDENGIEVYGGHNIEISGNTISSVGFGGAILVSEDNVPGSLTEVSDIRIFNNTITGGVNGINIGGFTNVENISIYGNKCSDQTRSGIGLVFGATSTVDSILVSNNIVSNVPNFGIELNGSYSAGIKGVLISENVISDITDAYGEGLSVHAASGMLATGNYVFNSSGYSCVLDAAIDSSVIGNVFSGAAKDGIMAYNSCLRVTIADNKVVGYATTGGYGIRTNGSDRIQILNNVLRYGSGAEVYAIYSTSTNAIVSGNILGYTPTFAAPFFSTGAGSKSNYFHGAADSNSNVVGASVKGRTDIDAGYANTDVSPFSVSQIWYNAGVAFSGILLAIDEGLSAAGSKILQVIGGAGGATPYLTIKKGGNTGIGVSSPTAVLHLKASSAAANSASLKIPPGTLATTPVSGNIESDGTHLYWTDSGGTRRQLDN